MRSSLWIPAVAPSVVGVFFMVFSSSVLAQITPDGTLGSEGSIVLPDQVVKDLPADLIQGGAVRGSNLFHSFLEFNVNEGQRVYFENPTGIDRILSRVTGSDVSDILGTLGVNGGADLFFLNPNGIIFGPNARLDIRGSFTASTGSAFTFSDGSEFRTVDPNAPPLLTVNVIPGVRYGALAEATLINNGQLQVGRDLTLGAPRLELGGGSLQAGRDLVLQGTQRLLAGGSYTVGGYLFTQDLAGNTIDVVVPHSNLIWGTGDVQFTENYSGESLYVLAGGAVSAGDGVNSLQITGGGAETINATLQDGQAITVSSDGKKRLDIRSGVDWTALLGSSPVNSGLGVNFNGATTSDINLAAVDIDTSSSSSVGVSGDGDQLVEAIGGDVRLMALENIAVKSINTSASVELEGTVPSGTVATFTGRAVAGDIDLEAGGDINTGSLQASGSSTVTITPEITTDGDIVIGGNAGGITEIVAAQGGKGVACKYSPNA
ncbi:MAG: filamentous hemagglutinin N-terminal domain-containing protein [Prochlorotrichaceae cyanobacterium]